jgi:hypothetical protein
VCTDKEASRCIKEMEDGLKIWDNSKRWQTLYTLGITQQLETNKAIVFFWTCGDVSPDQQLLGRKKGTCQSPFSWGKNE